MNIYKWGIHPFLSAAARAPKLSPELYMKGNYEFKYKLHTFDTEMLHNIQCLSVPCFYLEHWHREDQYVFSHCTWWLWKWRLILISSSQTYHFYPTIMPNRFISKFPKFWVLCFFSTSTSHFIFIMVVMLFDVHAEWMLDTSLLSQVARRKQLKLSKSVRAPLSCFVSGVLKEKCESEYQAVAIAV